MTPRDTLTFDLSDEQELVLAGTESASAVADDTPPEESYRAWNAHFVTPETPLEASA